MLTKPDKTFSEPQCHLKPFPSNPASFPLSFPRYHIASQPAQTCSHIPHRHFSQQISCISNSILASLLGGPRLPQHHIPGHLHFSVCHCSSLFTVPHLQFFSLPILHIAARMILRNYKSHPFLPCLHLQGKETSLKMPIGLIFYSYSPACPFATPHGSVI